MKPPSGDRRFNSIRRAFALGTCLGPVGYVASAGQMSRGSGPVVVAGGDGPTDPRNRPRDPTAAMSLPILAVEPLRNPDFSPPRDNRLGVVGLGFYTNTIVSLCSEVGLPIGFVVDDREGHEGDPFGAASHLARRGIPLLSAAEFAQRARQAEGGLVLVAGRIECQLPLALADDPYRQVARWVARTAPGAAAPLHPAALVERVAPLPCPNRYAVFGFPGSGNVLTQNLVEGLYARRPAEVPREWQVRSNLTEQYFYSVTARVHSLLHPLAPTRVEFIPYDFGTMRISVECGDRAGVVYDVPSNRHTGFQSFPTHSRPYRRAVDFFTSVSAPCVAVVRHPLETLLSGANKIERPAGPVLDDPQYLDRAAADLADWTAHLLATRDRVCVVRYEDLAARDVGELRRMAASVGVPISEAEAGELYGRYLNRNLTAATNKHFYRGGSDKWRGELTPEHLRRVTAHLPAEAFTAFGYEVPTVADLAPVPARGSPMPRSELYACLLGAYPLHPVPGPNGMRVCGSDADMVAGLLAAFGDPGLLATLDVGGTSDPVPRSAALA